MLDYAAAGEKAPTPVPTFMREQAEQEPDPRRIVRQLVDFWSEAHERTLPIFAVIRQAAALDPEVAEFELSRSAQRLRNYEIAARLLAEREAPRPGLTVEDAAASIFAVGHPDLYRFLVREQGWEPSRWAAWAETTLAAALLADGLPKATQLS